jgi:hypothetical protein
MKRIIFVLIAAFTLSACHGHIHHHQKGHFPPGQAKKVFKHG